MKPSQWVRLLVLGAGCVGMNDSLFAGTTQTLGEGSAVSRVDRSAVFDGIADHTPMSDYTEGNLFIGVDGDNWGSFDPFHGADGASPTFEFPDGGSYGWVDIHAVDSKSIYAIEFMYGNGWTTGGDPPWGNNLAYIEWQTWSGGTMVSSGTFGGPGQIVEMGTIVGFYDADGFDQLLVRCKIATSADPDLQALALDNLHVQMLECPASWWNYGAGWPGALGIPALVAGSAPVIGSDITVTIDNSSLIPTIGILMVGFGEASIPSNRDGTFLVALPWIMNSFVIPVGHLDLVDTIPSDPSLIGVELDVQAIEVDRAASRHISFTAGLALMLGV